MKPQDIIFFIVLAVVVIRRDAKLAILLGLFSLFVSIPLFSFWIFFTAERLTWYAAVFFLFVIVLNIIQLKKGKR